MAHNKRMSPNTSNVLSVIMGGGAGTRDHRDELVALVVAAEAASAAARPAEARRLAARAIERAPGSLDSIFAGMPRSTIWPLDPAAEPEPTGALLVDMAATGVGSHSAEAPRARSETAPSPLSTPGSAGCRSRSARPARM